MQQPPEKISIFWFRRDLRTDDNHALFQALSGQLKVLPIFIYDENILGELDRTDSRVTFIHRLLSKINKKFAASNSGVATFFGKPVEVFKQLVAENQIDSVFTNRDYEPYATARDVEVQSLLSKHNIQFHDFKDHVIFEQSEVVKPDGKPYLVFTPYSNKWKADLSKSEIPEFKSELKLTNLSNNQYPFLTLAEIGFRESAVGPPELNVSTNIIDNYSQTRNLPIKPTSYLGAHLRFGSTSIRKLVRFALSAKDPTFLNELIWREFFIQILFHFPHTVDRSFKPHYDHVQWRNNETDFKNWCQGKTGYPMVDAGMRELNATGFMHNRVRMITAGFLCKHLLIDWRWGEAYFATKLLDYEQASNVGNWQWAAGSGVDAAPYFRIFNPSEQLRKFDPKFEYVRKWIPEFDDLSYPQPIVDHAFARERCISTYKQALSQF